MDLVKRSILSIFKHSNKICSILNAFRQIEGENLMLTGGTLRNIVWNCKHKYEENYELEDCDVIFYNLRDTSKSYELYLKRKLELVLPEVNWSIKNQARMHIRNKHKQYQNIHTALSAFPETSSAVALDKNFEILSPFGLYDLDNLIIKPTLFCMENEPNIYIKRQIEKKWKSKWNKLNVNQINQNIA